MAIFQAAMMAIGLIGGAQTARNGEHGEREEHREDCRIHRGSEPAKRHGARYRGQRGSIEKAAT